MAATKINLTKLVRTIAANVIRGHLYENFFTQKFIIQKFLYMRISRSTVYVAIDDLYKKIPCFSNPNYFFHMLY